MHNSVDFAGRLEPLIDVGVAQQHRQGPVGVCLLEVEDEAGWSSLASGVEVQSNCPQPMRPVGPKRSTEGILTRVEWSVESL